MGCEEQHCSPIERESLSAFIKIIIEVYVHIIVNKIKLLKIIRCGVAHEEEQNSFLPTRASLEGEREYVNSSKCMEEVINWRKLCHSMLFGLNINFVISFSPFSAVSLRMSKKNYF